MQWTRLSGMGVALLGTALALVPVRSAQCLPVIPPGTSIDVYTEPQDVFLHHAFGTNTGGTVAVNLNVNGVSTPAQVTFTLVNAARLAITCDFGGGDTFSVGADLTVVNGIYSSFTVGDTFLGTGVFAGASATVGFTRTDLYPSAYFNDSPAGDGPRLVEWLMNAHITMPELPPPPPPPPPPPVKGGGGLTPGWWQNKNGQALIDSGDLAALTACHLVNANGSAFDPTTAGQVKDWIKSDATNMAYKLSSFVAAMKLNVLNGFVNAGALVYCDTSVDPSGQITIANLLIAADAALAADGYTPDKDPNRAYQESLKNALDAACNNLNWVNP